MPAVESLLALANSTPAGQTSNSQMMGSDELGEVFLQLLVKELENQDPLNPMEGTDFIMQLAQLSTLEQIRQMNNTLAAVQDMQQLTQANALIGREVRATGPDGSVVEGPVMGVSLADGAVALDVDGQFIPLSWVTEISGAVPEVNSALSIHNSAFENGG